MKTPSETVQAAQRLLAERERVGLAKYGTTVDRTDLQAGDWLKHAIEEASDLLLYLIRLQQAASDLMPRFTSPFASDGNCDPDADLLGNQSSCIRATHDRAAYLARWANAPAEATHLAQDSDGSCWFFYRQPKRARGEWIAEGGWARAGDNLLGRVACEPRPTPAVDPERARTSLEELVIAAKEMLAEDDGGMAAPRLRAALDAIGANPCNVSKGDV